MFYFALLCFACRVLQVCVTSPDYNQSVAVVVVIVVVVVWNSVKHSIANCVFTNFLGFLHNHAIRLGRNHCNAYIIRHFHVNLIECTLLISLVPLLLCFTVTLFRNSIPHTSNITMKQFTIYNVIRAICWLPKVYAVLCWLFISFEKSGCIVVKFENTNIDWFNSVSLSKAQNIWVHVTFASKTQ